MNTVAPARTHQWRGVIEEYGDLPRHPRRAPPSITLREGGTPLVQSGWLSELLGADVWLKVEGDNPTGSFKDRGMTVALSVAVGEGAEAVVCASTGNTSASMAAYAARAGVKPLVLVPQGKIAAGKLAQAIVHGAQVIMVRGNFDDCLRLSRGLADRLPGRAGQLGEPDPAPGAEDRVVRDRRLPRRRPRRPRAAGRQRRQHLGVLAGLPRGPPTAGTASRKPVMRGFQAAGAAPLVDGEPVADPETLASAIRIGNPASWKLAVDAAEESGGMFRKVTDEQILSAHSAIWPPATASSSSPRRQPASPGSSSSTARVRTSAGRTVVVTVTGHGLKDIDTALATFTDIVDTVVDADVEAAARAAGL